MGVTGVHPQTGLTTGDYEEAAIKRALSQASAETMVLASSEKLNAASQYKIVGLEEISGADHRAHRIARPAKTVPRSRFDHHSSLKPVKLKAGQA